MTPQRIPSTLGTAILPAVLCVLPSVRGQTGPQFEFRLAGDCGETVLGDSGMDYDDGTGGRDLFFDKEVFQREFLELPTDSPGHTWDVILRTTENPTLEGAEPRGAQGWSWSLGTEGVLRITDVTTNGTVSCLGGPGLPRRSTCLQRGGFEFCEITGPPDGAGPQTDDNRGALCAVVLSRSLPITLPPDLEDAVVAKLRIAGRFPAEPGASAAGTLFFAARRGSGQPIPNVVTFDGLSFRAGTDPPLRLADCEVVLEASSSSPSFIRGDADGDGRIVVTDAVLLVRVLLGRAPARYRCEDALDVNDDDRSDLSDVVRLLRYLFAGGDPPPPPFPGCGADPDDSDGDDCRQSSVFCRDTG